MEPSAPLIPSPGPTPAPGRLHARRCVRHAEREAVAQCPGCGGSFCRECVSEHDGRLLCANCLAKLPRASVETGKTRRWVAGWRQGLATGAAVLLAWLFFYGVGRLLPKLPEALHDGQTWLAGEEADRP